MLQPGDIAACYGTDFVSRLIRFGTGSLRRPMIGPSHVAMIGRVGTPGLAWFESTSMCPTPCLVRHEHVEGVQVQIPAERIRHYLASGGRVEIYRPVEFRKFTPEESKVLTSIVLRDFLGCPYDFGGAMLAGTRAFKCSALFPGADLHSLFCSEMLAAILMRFNRLNHANPTRYSPASLIRELLQTGVYRLVHTFPVEV